MTTTIYLDQSIISGYVQGRFNLATAPDTQYVYSWFNLLEIHKSDTPEKYLYALAELDASFMYISSNDEIKLAEGLIPTEVYAAFKGNHGTIDTRQNLKAFEFVIYFMEEISRYNASEMRFREKNYQPSTEFAPDTMRVIWENIDPSIREETPERYFQLHHLTQDTPRNRLLGFCSCCRIFDGIRFHSERPNQKSDYMTNTLCDAAHIAMASYCDSLLSADKKMILRAEALYQFTQLQTVSQLATEKETIREKAQLYVA